ncbi:MAG TPA: O-antigen ligase family protein [Burkholderiaceae bacterium]|nr:O-antigen ligase family protein [Burkholderiaceae bacterium]
MAFYLIAMPLMTAAVESWAPHDVARAVQLLVLGSCGLLLLGRLWVGVDACDVRLGVATICWGLGILLLAALAVLYAPVLRAAMLELAFYVLLGALAVQLAWALGQLQSARWDAWRWLSLTLLASSALLAFGIAVRYLAGLAEGSLLRAWLVPGFSNYRFFNHVQTITLPLLAAAAVWPGLNTRARRLAWGLLALEFCWLLFVGGRATMLALAAGALAVALLFRSLAWHWLRALLTAALLGALLFALLFVVVPRSLGMQTDFQAADTLTRTARETGHTRLYLWQIARENILESPWLGIGPQHFAHWPNQEAAHPHNVYLQLAAEWGLPMFLAVLLAAAMAFRRWVAAVRRSAPKQASAWGMGLTAAFVSIAVDGMLSGNFVMPNAQMWIALSFAMAFVYARQWPRAHADAGGGFFIREAWRRFASSALLAFALMGLWRGVWPEVLNVPAHVERVRERVPNGAYNPRIWSHGWF